MPLPPYADVLVPLPLPNLLTYATEGVEDALEVGMRVVVQVGARKRYTGVVCRLHQDAPKGYAARAMDAVVDDRPVVTPVNCACGNGWPGITCAPAVKSWRRHFQAA